MRGQKKTPRYSHEGDRPSTRHTAVMRLRLFGEWLGVDPLVLAALRQHENALRRGLNSVNKLKDGRVERLPSLSDTWCLAEDLLTRSRTASRLVAPQPELGLQLQRGDAVRVARDDVGCQEPGLQREVAAVHHGAGRRGGLATAVRALPRDPAALQGPPPAPASRGTCKALRPPAICQVLRAGVVVRELLLEVLARQRATITLPASGHLVTEAQFSVEVKPRRLPYAV